MISTGKIENNSFNLEANSSLGAAPRHKYNCGARLITAFRSYKNAKNRFLTHFMSYIMNKQLPYSVSLCMEALKINTQQN